MRYPYRVLSLYGNIATKAASLSPDDRALLGTAPDTAVAKRLDLSPWYVLQIRRYLNIPAYCKGRPKSPTEQQRQAKAPTIEARRQREARDANRHKLAEIARMR